MPLKLHFMKCSERNISQCILASTNLLYSRCECNEQQEEQQNIKIIYAKKFIKNSKY